MFRRITVASSKSPLITTTTVSSSRPALFTAAWRPVHTNGELKFGDDAEAARKRKQLEEEIKAGKLPEVSREEEFRPESVIQRAREAPYKSSSEPNQNEDLPRASQSSKTEQKVASDDFAEENSGISDAQMKPEKQLHVHDAPPLKRGGRDESYVSEALGGNEDGSIGSKNRAKMNASEHHQKYTARGNLNGMDRSNRHTSTSSGSSGEKISGAGISNVERSFASDQVISSSDLSGGRSEGKNPEWSSASASTNETWVADNQTPSSTYTDPKSEKRQERHSTRSPRTDGSTSSFPQGGFQKRSYATDASDKNDKNNKNNKEEAIIGDSPIPTATSVSYSTSKSFSASSEATKASKRYPVSPNIEMADLVHEKPMSEDDKGTQAKRNEAKFGKGWQERLKGSNKDYSSGSAGAPARNMRDKPVNYKRAYSTQPNSATAYTTAIEDVASMVREPLGMNWRVTQAQGSKYWPYL